MSRRSSPLLAAVAVQALVASCGFNPTGPFQGFDGQGSRVRGSFESGAAAQSAVSAAATALAPQGISVSIRERPSLATTVGSDGSFSLTGVPSGSISLLFQRDGRHMGEIPIRDVRRNQEITIVVSLIEDEEVVLLDEQRDQVSFQDECPRGAGFWCQNQGGKNPNLTAEEFQQFAAEAAALLSAVPALDAPEEIASVVCHNGDQLLRQLAALALNLAAETLTPETPLNGEPYATVGEAFDAAVALAAGDGSRDERNRVKDVLDRINNNQNHDACADAEGDEDDDGDDEDDDGGAPPSGKMTICHIPPGNPTKRHTITIGASAWPAHQRHGDTIGACR